MGGWHDRKRSYEKDEETREEPKTDRREGKMKTEREEERRETIKNLKSHDDERISGDLQSFLSTGCVNGPPYTCIHLHVRL